MTAILVMQDKVFHQIYRDLYGDAMLVPIRIGTNMMAGRQQKHVSLSFATKRKPVCRGTQKQ